MKPSRFVGVWTATVAAVVIAIGAALSAQAQAFQSGFRMLKVPYYDGYIDVALWYPTNAAEADRSFGAYRMQVSMNAQAASGKVPLVVVSHGTGGRSLSHYRFALALARSGFIVAAPEHPGDNYRDRSLVADARYGYERPRQVSRVLDDLLAARMEGQDRQRPHRRGRPFGGRRHRRCPDRRRSRPEPSAHALPDGQGGSRLRFPRPEIRRRAGRSRAAGAARLGGPPSGSVSDPRIRAAVLLAPFGVPFVPGSFKESRATVLLIGAEFDEVLARQYNYEYLRQQLPSAAAHLAAGAGHYSFTAPPMVEFRAAFGPEAQDPQGFDREAFQAQLSGELVEFFSKALR